MIGKKFPKSLYEYVVPKTKPLKKNIPYSGDNPFWIRLAKEIVQSIAERNCCAKFEESLSKIATSRI